VQVALGASAMLEGEGIPCAVVSLPCWELFAEQDEGYRLEVLGDGVLRVGIEAASGFGWSEWLGGDGLFIGMSGFGASAPAEHLFHHFGFTPEAVASAVRKRLGV
jgi:transketolase